jgi:CTP-dependent riboflavin kinase
LELVSGENLRKRLALKNGDETEVVVELQASG